MFQASRLRLARLRLGWTLTKLADESGTSLRSLTNYENGKQAPSDERAKLLALALRVPPSFFFGDPVEPVPVAAASFRKLSKTTATRRDAVLANATLALHFYGVIDDRFRLPCPDVPSLDKMSPEQAADLVRHRWNLGDRPIPNLLHLLESRGIRVASLRHEYRDIDSFCLWRDAVPYVFLNTAKTGERQRFDLAHELGHLVQHGDLDMDTATSKMREAEANTFAASLLMPRSAVINQSMRAASIERILAARTYWRVSAMAMTHRLHELELLSPWQYRSTCIALSERGFRSNEPGGIVPETSQLLRKVMYGNGARITVKQAAQKLRLDVGDVREFLQNLVPISA